MTSADGQGVYLTHAEHAALLAELAEARRRRDAWKAKADGYDEIRLALRKKVGSPWPPNMSRILWAAIAADEKKRADDAEAERDALRNAQSYTYIGKDGKPILARDLEDQRDALLAERDRLREALAEHSMPCTCHEAYSGRKMQDPECRAGEYGDHCREAIGLPPLCQYNIRALKGGQT